MSAHNSGSRVHFLPLYLSVSSPWPLEYKPGEPDWNIVRHCIGLEDHLSCSSALLYCQLMDIFDLQECTVGLSSSFQMTHERVKKKNKQRASEMNLAAILLCIVFLFLVCHFPRILLNVHEIFMLGDMMTCGNGESFDRLFWIIYEIHNSFKDQYICSVS